MFKVAVLIAVALLAGSASAGVNCPGFHQRPSNSNEYIVLIYLGGVSPSLSGPARTSRLQQLQINVSAKMQGFVSSLAQGLPTHTRIPTIVLVACDFLVEPTDLGQRDIGEMVVGNVVAVLWGGSERGKPSVVHLSVPRYERNRDQERSKMEVVWEHVSPVADSFDDWSKELDRGSLAQQSFLAMGVGLLALKHQQLGLAKKSLCQARAIISALGKDQLIRPVIDEVRGELLRLIEGTVGEAEQAARAKGDDLNKVQSIRLTCGHLEQ